jgi:hypothetical protein
MVGYLPHRLVEKARSTTQLNLAPSNQPIIDFNLRARDFCQERFNQFEIIWSGKAFDTYSVVRMAS